jgi:hypothetical protein
MADVSGGCLDNAKRRDLPATPVERDVDWDPVELTADISF